MTTRRRRRIWTPDEKREVVTTARRRLAEGTSFRRVAAELGILEGSLRLWMRQLPERGLQPVTVIDVAAPTRDLICLVTPGGFRFEGLDLATAARLWEQLK